MRGSQESGEGGGVDWDTFQWFYYFDHSFSVFRKRFFFPPNIYLFMWLYWVFVAACKLSAVACGIWFLEQGSDLGPLHWECGVSDTGPPVKSPGRNLKKEILREKKTDQEEEEPGKRGRAFLLCRHQTLTQAAQATHTLAHFAFTSAIVHSFHSDPEEWVPPKMTCATTLHRVLSWARPLTTWPRWPVPCFRGWCANLTLGEELKLRVDVRRQPWCHREALDPRLRFSGSCFWPFHWTSCWVAGPVPFPLWAPGFSSV